MTWSNPKEEEMTTITIVIMSPPAVVIRNKAWEAILKNYLILLFNAIKAEEQTSWKEELANSKLVMEKIK